MRTTGWFAAAFASFATVAGAAEGTDVSARPAAATSRFAIEGAKSVFEGPSRATVVEPARVNLPSLGRDPLTENALRAERGDALARAGCRQQDVCYDAAEGRVVYRGARRYMPSWNGMQPEGLSLKRDRLVLRYSFR